MPRLSQPRLALALLVTLAPLPASPTNPPSWPPCKAAVQGGALTSTAVRLNILPGGLNDGRAFGTTVTVTGTGT